MAKNDDSSWYDSIGDTVTGWFSDDDNNKATNQKASKSTDKSDDDDSWYDSIGDTFSGWFGSDDKDKKTKKSQASASNDKKDDDTDLFNWDSIGEGLMGLFSNDKPKSNNSGKSNTAKAKSAAPEENRVSQESIAQEPNGKVARTNGFSSNATDNGAMLRYALFGMMALGLVIAFKE